jgi:hypothetical protein
MPANEPVPLGVGVIVGRVAGDVVADGLCLFAVAQNFAPYGDDASCVGESAFYGTCGQNGNGALFDAPVGFFCASVAGLGPVEGLLERLEQVALVSFDLKEVFAAFFYDGAGGFVLVV